MIAVMPIFFEKGSEFWNTIEGKALLQKSIDSGINAKGIEKLVIFSNSDGIRRITDSLGIDSYTIDIEHEIEKPELLPFGTYSSLRYLQKTIKLEFKDLIVLSYRNPLLTSDMIDEAIKKYSTSGKNALISVKQSVDHPCQLSSYYKTLNIGFIHLLDYDTDINPYLQILNNLISTKPYSYLRNQRNLSNQRWRLTNPFHFNWEARGIQEKTGSGIYYRTNEDYQVKYVPVGNNLMNESNEIPSFFWIYENHNTARVFLEITRDDDAFTTVNRNDMNHKLVGVGFSDMTISTLLFSDDEGINKLFILDSADLPISSYFVRAIPVTLSTPLYSDIMETEGSDISKPFPLHELNKNISGIIYFLLIPAQDDSYDLTECFNSINKLWSTNTATGARVNLLTGKNITGRQDFPDVFEPDGTFFILNENSISLFDLEISRGNAYGFIIEESESIQIDSNLDFLRYKAKQKATHNCSFKINLS
jgi:CMP-N-acetylneuraminic acid synthetase